MKLSKMNKKGYIDPGTGGMILGSVWPFILLALGAVAAFFLKIFYNPLKRLFTGK
jgi:hypothetical protein